MSAPTGRFRPSDRLLAGRQFERVLRHGVRTPSGPLVLMAASGGAEAPRLGLTVGKRVGNAVVRNGVKRRIREWFRRRRGALGSDTDIVVIGRHGAGLLSGHEVDQHLDVALERTQAKL